MLVVVRAPKLSLNATSANALFAQLSAIDITVPLITEGRTSQHREQYMMARFLATAAKIGKIGFPLNLMHGDKPDFVLTTAGIEVGVECVEAVPEEWYAIEALRERHYPNALNFGQIYHPTERIFDKQTKIDIASGKHLGSTWVGSMPKLQWVAAMEHFIGLKTDKLRSGNYSSHGTMWLIIQDEWRVPLYRPQEVQEAALECMFRIDHLLSPPCFRAIFICSGNLLLCIENGQLEVAEIHDLWRDRDNRAES
ncbi:MAG: hypothetical protein AB1710_06910 [Pseudomonadota bacterium]